MSAITEKKLSEAIKLISLEMFNSIEHGEEIFLNNYYHFYRYQEEDIYVVKKTENDNELLQAMISGSSVVFEELV